MIERSGRVVAPLAVLALWEIAVRAHLLDARFFPAPSAIAGSFWRFVRDGELASNGLVTLQRILVGLALGAIPGIAVGLVAGVNRYVAAIVDPLIALFNPVPKIALLPLVLLIFGIGEAGKYALVAVGVFFVMAINTSAGVRQIDPLALDVARVYRLRPATFYARVLFPAALPNLFAGLRIAIGLAVVLAVAAELRAASSGLGYVIWNSWETLRVERMYVALVAISLLGYGLTLLGTEIERVALPWRRPPT